MADKTSIEWTDATWNPITGCAIVSPGCRDCYAMQLAGTRLRHHATRAGLTREVNGRHVWTGEVRLNAKALTQPLEWQRARRIFVCAHGDLFAEDVPDAWIDQVFAVMALAHRHTFQVLTKRAARMRAYVSDPATPGRIARAIIDRCLIERAWRAPAGYWPVYSIGDVDLPNDVTIVWPLRNVWKGVSAERQEEAEARVPALLATAAAIRFVSAEPLLSAIRFMRLAQPDGTSIDALHGHVNATAEQRAEAPHRWLTEHQVGLDWIIAGGESGPRARPMHPDWARQIRDDCATAGVAFHFKQWGRWSPDYHPGHPAAKAVTFGEPLTATTATLMAPIGKKGSGRMLDGRTHDAFPADPEPF